MVTSPRRAYSVVVISSRKTLHRVQAWDFSWRVGGMENGDNSPVSTTRTTLATADRPIIGIRNRVCRKSSVGRSVALGNRIRLHSRTRPVQDSVNKCADRPPGTRARHRLPLGSDCRPIPPQPDLPSHSSDNRETMAGHATPVQSTTWPTRLRNCIVRKSQNAPMEG